jgi:hypothetical protein
MDMYRIEGEWVQGGTSAFGQTFELVAGFTEKSFIAGGNWFGAVKDFDTVYPFVLTDDGYCRYAGVRAEARFFSIVKRPVKVGEIFELTWDDHEDVHCYRVTKVARLNINNDYLDDEPQPSIQPSVSTSQINHPDAKQAPGIFLKNSLIWNTPRPEAFKASVSSLIAIGNAVAVGEDEIEFVFTDAKSFNSWFESISPKKF